MSDEPPETIMLISKNVYEKTMDDSTKTQKDFSKLKENQFDTQTSTKNIPSFIHFNDKNSAMWMNLAIFFFIAVLILFYLKK
jgi:hypothetical protein